MAGSYHGRFARQPDWGKHRLLRCEKVALRCGRVKTFALYATRGWKAA